MIPTATKHPDMFGIVPTALLSALKGTDAQVVWFTEKAGVALVSTPFLLLRATAIEALCARHPPTSAPHVVETMQARFQRLEAGRVVGRLRVTTALLEGDSTLARKCLVEQGEPVYLSATLLPIFGIERAADATRWQLDLIEVDTDAPTQRRPVRLSRAGHTTGYLMPMQHLTERVW